MEVKNLNENSWITGFVDGEGCFSISFNLRAKMNHGIEIRPSFSVSQKRDREGLNHRVLNLMMIFFKGGSVRFSKNNQVWKYESRDIEHLCEKIIPYFEINPLMTSKKNDFEKFKRACFLIKSKHHLSLNGIKEIIEASSMMNITGKRKYSKDFLLKLLNKVKI